MGYCDPANIAALQQAFGDPNWWPDACPRPKDQVPVIGPLPHSLPSSSDEGPGTLIGDGGNNVPFGNDPIYGAGGFLDLGGFLGQGGIPPISANNPLGQLIDLGGQILTTALFPSAGGVGAATVGTSYEQAPKAGLITGACPPGRVVRHQRGRNICMKKPHMNVLNPHALSRSTRRVSGFLKRVRNVEKAIRHSMAGTGVVSHVKRSSGRKSGCFSCGRPARSCSCG